MVQCGHSGARVAPRFAVADGINPRSHFMNPNGIGHSSLRSLCRVFADRRGPLVTGTRPIRFGSAGQGKPGGASCVRGCRGTSCVLCTRGRSRKRRKSNARLCRAMHICAAVSSEGIARSNGQLRRRKILRWRSAALCGLLLMKSQANARRQTNQCWFSSIESLRGDA